MDSIPDFRPDVSWEEAKRMQREREAAQREQSRAMREGGRVDELIDGSRWTKVLYFNLKRVYRGWPFQLRRRPLPERI